MGGDAGGEGAEGPEGGGCTEGEHGGLGVGEVWGERMVER